MTLIRISSSDLSKRIEFLFPFVYFKIKATRVQIDHRWLLSGSIVYGSGPH